MTPSIALLDVAATTDRDGLAAGLTAVLDPGEPVPCSPGGRTLVPQNQLSAIDRWSLAGLELPGRNCRVAVEPNEAARSEFLVQVRVTRRDDTRYVDHDVAGPRRDRPGDGGWPGRLLAVRAGLGRRVIRAAVDQLSGRVSDGAPLTERQLVRAEIAEIAIVLETVELVLAEPSTEPAIDYWHGELDRTDLALARLFGAGGYLDDHPARALRVAGLVRDVWAPRSRGRCQPLVPSPRPAPASSGPGRLRAAHRTGSDVTLGATSIAELRAQVREHAPDLRSRALDVDAHPELVDRHLDSPGMRLVHRISTGPVERQSDRCLRLTAATLEAARGDAGVLMASPGPSLAGVVIDQLADDAQRERFRSALADGRSWAFCAITEPQGGSDVLGLRAELRRTPDGLLLSGTKTYVGNASRSRLGVVLARTGPTPLHIRAVVVPTDLPGVTGAALPMAGLRGARIGRLTLTDVPVPDEDVLGSHLPPSRRGIWGAIRAFASVRVQVGAMAVATAAAVCDYVGEHAGRSAETELAVVRARVLATERLVLRAAAEVDRGDGRGQLSALAKIAATRLAGEVTWRLPAMLGPGALLDHPLLDKWRRDAAGFEFMEGTSAIQLLHVADGALRDPRHRAPSTASECREPVVR